MNLFRLLCTLGICTLFYLPMEGATATLERAPAELWRTLASGKSVVLMRHALAPGGGDPANFVVDQCNTQRNLSPEGRVQAQKLGELFRRNAIANADVFSSLWCRCLDTAKNLKFGEPVALPTLNSFFQDRSTANQQTVDVQQWIRSRLENEKIATMLPAILVSHQVNITALTNVYPASGELVFVGIANNEVVTLGRIKPE